MFFVGVYNCAIIGPPSILKLRQQVELALSILATTRHILLDFSLTVKAATLIFISGCDSAISSAKEHTGKCIRRFGGIYAYCRYFIDRKW